MGGVKREYYQGCIGCVDFSDHAKFCDYLGNNGHVRPCPAGPDGCRLKSREKRKNVPAAVTWDTGQARKLLAKGMTRRETADKLGISINELGRWLHQEMDRLGAVPG